MVPKKCKGCGNRFVVSSTISKQQYCDKCGDDSRRKGRKEIKFIGVDGEGVKRPDGTHEYILLSVGSESLYHNDGSRLSFYEIVDFLWQCFLKDPDAAYVGFYLGYDFTQWLRDLPENRAHMLLSKEGIALRRRERSGGNHLPFPVEHRGWNFDFLGFKRFRLWRNGSNLRMYICDTGPYFQTSFLNAIDPVKWPDGPVITDDEYKKISIGKSERGEKPVPWGTPVDPEMIEYNILENEVLSRLMFKYNEGLNHVGISLKRDQWYGPGQAAQSWMNSIVAPTRVSFEEVTPIEIRNRLRASYYGGWFEIFAHGHIRGQSWSYDINSAYPDIQSTLPCCLHGVWKRETGNFTSRNSNFVLGYGTIKGKNDYVGAAMHRLPTGHILRPQITKGWYWLHEIQTGIKAGVIDDFTFEEWIQYEPCDCNCPFRNLRQLYEDRIRVGKNTIGGKSRRLVYNSTYGKTAQSIGAAKYANPFYASLITSFCRTKILEAISTHPYGANDALMVATDGITFRHRHPFLDLSDTELGKWSESQHNNLTLFMPGVYWDDNTRSKLSLGEHPSLKSRGVSARALAVRIGDIDDQFDNVFSGRGFPICELPINFNLVSPKQALARGKWETCGHVINDGIRVINSDPIMKRVAITSLEDGIVRSFCYKEPPGGIETTPYPRTFGDRELEEILTPDGDIDMLFAHAIGND